MSLLSFAQIPILLDILLDLFYGRLHMRPNLQLAGICFLDPNLKTIVFLAYSDYGICCLIRFSSLPSPRLILRVSRNRLLRKCAEHNLLGPLVTSFISCLSTSAPPLRVLWVPSTSSTPLKCTQPSFHHLLFHALSVAHDRIPSEPAITWPPNVSVIPTSRYLETRRHPPLHIPVVRYLQISSVTYRLQVSRDTFSPIPLRYHFRATSSSDLYPCATLAYTRRALPADSNTAS
ncbi:hypothetical protein FB45DRAFT_1058331 [Roridomyces roridus]|uniref:Uncharacterized protein n=1 Tax=Roridomyces roridus TaxID=1738132 RepID=A0AAD7BTG7_9AGAR|nr:hypothetical protein FB45DRAFT_1058331 [Roridomyces roridus]